MNATTLFLSLVTLASPAIAQQKPPAAPPLVHQINNGNWLSQNEAESLRDELFYQRAIHAYERVRLSLFALDLFMRRDYAY